MLCHQTSRQVGKRRLGNRGFGLAHVCMSLSCHQEAQRPLIKPLAALVVSRMADGWGGKVRWPLCFNTLGRMNFAFTFSVNTQGSSVPDIVISMQSLSSRGSESSKRDSEVRPHPGWPWYRRKITELAAVRARGGALGSGQWEKGGFGSDFHLN